MEHACHAMQGVGGVGGETWSGRLGGLQQGRQHGVAEERRRRHPEGGATPRAVPAQGTQEQHLS